MNEWHTAYIGLGSNLAQPDKQLAQAITALQNTPHMRFLQCSDFYQSKPLNNMPQPDYLNAVAQIETELSPLALLDELQRIEQQQHRQRSERWAARTLDLDLLLYGKQTIQHPRLTIPHYAMHERPFVILPLLSIAPSLTLPSGQTVAEIAQLLNLESLHIYQPASEK